MRGKCLNTQKNRHNPINPLSNVEPVVLRDIQIKLSVIADSFREYLEFQSKSDVPQIFEVNWEKIFQNKEPLLFPIEQLRSVQQPKIEFIPLRVIVDNVSDPSGQFHS